MLQKSLRKELFLKQFSTAHPEPEVVHDLDSKLTNSWVHFF